MKPRFYHKLPADFLSGKALLILIVILCSALSFLLGYFVGRIQAPERPALISMNAEQTTSDDLQELPLSEDTGIEAEDTSGPLSDTSSQVMDTEKGGQAAGIKSHTGSEPGAAIPAVKKAGKDTSAEKKAAKKATSGKRSKAKKEKALKKKTSFYYTIQVGAFKNKKQAERLKNQLKKKGYSAKVISATGKNKSVYRVWVGRFESRSAARLNAVKLAKNSGVKTLVLKTDR